MKIRKKSSLLYPFWRISLSRFTLLTLISAFSGVSHNIYAGQFTRITTGDVVTDAKGGRSANFADIDNDGDLDLFISNGKSGGENNMLYRNVGGVLIRDITDPVTLDGRSSDGATFADIDNDGDLDLFVANWYNQNNLLYRNNGAGVFTQDVVDIVASDQGYSEAGSWADYDNDGFVDLFVANSEVPKKNALYHNDGDGTFTEVTTGVLVTDVATSRLGAWADFDNDGDLDVYVCHENGESNAMYRNDGAGAFVRIITGDFVNNPSGNCWTASWGDYDNDLDLDLVVGNQVNGTPELYQNNGDGTFTTVTTGPVVGTSGWTTSSSWVDYDNDGDLDLFLVNGFGTLNAKKVNYLFENSAGTFTRILNDTLVQDSGWGYGHSWGDYDNDGDVDVVVARWRNENENDALYRNDLSNGNHWLKIRLSGIPSNHAAIGARVYASATINGNPVTQMREVSSQDGYCTQNSLEVEFGFGATASVDSLRVKWPSGDDTTLYAIATDQILAIGECADPDNDGICSASDVCPNDPLNDADNDGACDGSDNCLGLANPGQEDTDNDNLGDLCDSCPLNPLNPCCCLVAGDSDHSSDVSIGDASYLIAFIFSAGSPPSCQDEGDADASGDLTIADVTTLISYIFSGGADPVCGTLGV